MKRTPYVILILMLLTSIFLFGLQSVFAQDEARVTIVTQDNLTQFNKGDIFTVTIQAEEIVDLSGVQFELDYNPSLIQVVESGIKLRANMSAFGGITTDFENGRIVYPII